MTNDTKPEEKERRRRTAVRGGGSEAVYGLGLIGAWVYFFSHATTFWIGVLAFFKGLVWPALLVFELLKYLKM